MTLSTAKMKGAAHESAFAENVKTILYALALAMAIRFAVVQPFRIPTGSMQPTLMVGDYIVVTKWSYGYGRFSIAPLEGLAPPGRLFGAKPKRGDVVVFRPASKPNVDYVKRLVGLPGDQIQMKDGLLYINDVAVKREPLGLRPFKDKYGVQDIPAYKETLPNGVSYTTFDRDPQGALDNTGVYEVPDGRYFMMGDDRDNSADSRTTEVGPVPFDHLVGHAQFVFLSFDETTALWKPWTLLTGLRFDRFLKGVE